MTAYAELLVDAIRIAVAERGWTHKELSTNCDVPESTVQKYLSGKTQNPSFDYLVSMCRPLNLSIDAVCGIDSNSAVEEIARLRAALAFAEAQQKAAEAQRETAETRLQAEIDKASEMREAYEYRIDIAKDRTIWIRRALIAVSAVCVGLMASIIGILIYDVTHTDRGWFQTALPYFNTGMQFIKDLFV